MALKQLDAEQVRTWTLEQKDRWWFENVWKGDMPQLTLRSALTGMLLGGVLSMTNLYVGAKTGWTLGVGITSVILAFGLFKVLEGVGLGREFTILENNAMQSIATAAGYMTSPMISSLAAYMLVTGKTIPMAQTFCWIMALAVLGVLFAFPLKRRFINDEQHPFPEGRAAGIVMDALHSGDAQTGLFKAKILVVSGALAAVLKLFQSHDILAKVKLAALAIPDYLDAWIYKFTTLNVRGVDLRELTVRLDSDFVLMATGGLMGIRTGVSLLIGAVLNYLILVPWAINHGDIPGVVTDGVRHFGFREVTKWALWGGVAMMTASSLFAFFAKPKVVFGAFRGMWRKGATPADTDPLRNIELPLRVFVIGIPLVGTVVVLLAHWFFDVSLALGFLAIPLVFVFALIGVNSTALTSITPSGALGKLTQLTFGVLAPGNIKTNLMTAGITGEVALHASNLLMDIKPGYMLGAKPRQQAIGHVLGILAGALVSVPVFYLAFMHGGVNELFKQQPMPAASVWQAVAQLLTQGLSNLRESARWAALFGALLGIALEALRLATKGRFWLSGVGIGLASVIPFNTCLSMFLGALIFWIAGKVFRKPESAANKLIVQNQEPICGGIIAGGAIMGIVVILLENLVFAGGQ